MIKKLNIRFYHNRWYKYYITSLKAVLNGESLISAGLDIDRFLPFDFCVQKLKIYRQKWGKKKWEGGVKSPTPPPRTAHPRHVTIHDYGMEWKRKSPVLEKIIYRGVLNPPINP